jgi:MFS family permease
VIDRVGARPVAIVCVCGIGIGSALLAFTGPSIWTFYALYALRSAVSVGSLPPTFAKVVGEYFERRRGMALGIALCTTGIGAIILPTYVQTLISAFGWRAAYVGLGLLPLCLALPAILLFMPRKGEGPAAAGATDRVAAGLTLGEALRGYRFWVMAVLALFGGLALSGLIANLVPMLVDRGFSPAEAARQIGLYGLTIIVGRLVSGWLLDRFWAPAVGSAFLLAPCAGVLMLASGIDTSLPVAIAVVMIALASGAEFDLIAFLCGRYYGQRAFSTIYSIHYACFGVGAGAAPAIYGIVHDRTGSYAAVLSYVAIGFACAAAAILTLGRYPRFAAAR